MEIICPFCKKTFELSKRKRPAYMNMSLADLDKHIKLLEKTIKDQKSNPKQ